MKRLIKVIYIVACFSVIACQQNNNAPNKKTPLVEDAIETASTKEFNNYWYSGKAELNSYELKQSRYGEIRNGEALLIFVTEPFSLNKQVKLDNPRDAGSDQVSVMKLNAVRKFPTGIYDYTISSSTFTPINSKKHPHTLKSNTSIQEW